MHILHLIKTSQGATWALNQLAEMKLKDPSLTFSVILPDGGRHVEEYRKICRNVYFFEYTIGLSTLSSGLKFKQIVLDDKPDIIHSWFTQTTLYMRLFLRNIPIPRLFQVVGPLHLETPIIKKMDIWSAQKNDYWIATSLYIKDKYLQAGVPNSKVLFNYPFIDSAKLLRESASVESLDLRSKYQIPDDTKIIGTASYFYKPKFWQKNGVKGHEQLLRVFKIILQKRQDIVLVIAGTTLEGSKDYETKLKSMAADIDPHRIIFTGGYSHVFNIINNFDVFVYLSKSENLGGVFESLLFKIPTVSSDRGALPELVHNNVTGFAVPLDNDDYIAEKIMYLLDHDIDEWKVEGQKLVLKTLNKESIIDTAISIYNKFITI
jgi:glycosyltransferase involved in cell wall biosynthesis